LPNFEKALPKVSITQSLSPLALVLLLHDNLGGTLTMIKMGIDSLNEDLSADEYTHEKLESLMEMAGSAIRMTRAITQGLRPPMLDTLGLGPTIEWYVGEFSRMSNIECLVHVSVGIHLSELMTIGLLRIVQEGLNNIAKHAEATYVSVLATSEAPGELTLMISDNGKGVEDRPSKSISSGLLGMRERIHRMGGTFLLNRATGSIGTSILIKVPTA
jgi:signal transduction histidine kinase